MVGQAADSKTAGSNVKVKFSLEQTMKAQRGRRSIAVLFL
jgi:hypothetical protein